MTPPASASQRPKLGETHAPRPRRRDCWRSGHTVPDARRRGRVARHPRASASSGRTSACGLGVTTTAVSPAPTFMQCHLRADQHELQIVAQGGEQVVSLAGCGDFDLGLQEEPTAPPAANILDLLGDLGAHRANRLPPCRQRRLFGTVGQGVPGRQHDAVATLQLHDLLGGEGKDRRHQPRQALHDVPQRALRRTACA